MAKRIHRRLKKALEEQKNLEDELNKLQDSQDPTQACKEVIDFVQVVDGAENVKDPMVIDENPFKQDCFVAGTRITTNAKGDWVPIENLRVGDKVVGLTPDRDINETISTNIEEYPKELNEFVVTSIYMATKRQVTSIMCRDKSTSETWAVTLTEGHPMWVNGEGWKTVSGTYSQKHGYRFAVKALEIGDELCTQEGHLAEVISIETNKYPDGVAVFNLSVSGGRTFFANRLISHNKGCDCVIL